ncbi:MAG TPA: metalloregulator ArsR/SmtB family transcription factor [Chitinophagaceae bacterium]|jgi:DNA-binding transcriptional ArsR family regulator|nr:metalloregulator ArsR/SmtB family transcription factor [Chitinophagaceae bacterium]
MSNYSIILNTLTTTGEAVRVDLLNTRKAALIFRAINNKLRQQILKSIDELGAITVSQLCEKLFLEQSVASQHLAILRKAGFVKTSRKGKFIYYSVDADRLLEMNRIAADLTK